MSDGSDKGNQPLKITLYWNEKTQTYSDPSGKPICDNNLNPIDKNSLPATQQSMDDGARVWLKARNVIMEFLKETCPDMSELHLEHNAAAIIARLSHANLLIEEVDIA